MTRTSHTETVSTMFRMLRGKKVLVTLVDLSLVGLILLNVLAVILESVDSIREQHAIFFRWFDTISVIVFTIEYVGRLWFCVDHESPRFRHPIRGRVRYALTPLAIIDLVAFLPFYLAFFVTVDLRMLRVLRLFRIFKLTRYSSAMTILLRVLREELPSFTAALFILAVILVLAASGIYLVEQEAQPEAFGNIPSAMWWAVATLTTVGYGDVTPITPAGKLFGSLITVIGIGMVALPAGILASAFSDHLRRRREEYRELVRDALTDGDLTRAEGQALIEKRNELNLDPAEARRLRAEARTKPPSTCPRCGFAVTGPDRARGS